MSYYKPGDHNAVCDKCGFRFKFSQLRRDGDNRGLWVCRKCYDPEHPQDNVRVKPDRQGVRVSRPEPEPEFVSETRWDDTLKAWV